MTYVIIELLLSAGLTYGVLEPKTDCQTLSLLEPGSDYVGSVSQTKTGITCQSWQSQSWHPHSYGHHGNHNYCRNDDTGVKGVWCFTSSFWTRWDYCDVKG